MSLDPMPGITRLKQLAAERQRERFGKVVDPALAADVRAHTTMAMTRTLAGTTQLTTRRRVEQLDPAVTARIRAIREEDTLVLEVLTPPRTKKNNRRMSFARRADGSTYPKIIPSKAFEKYQTELTEAIATVASALHLPLPDRMYNIAAEYFVDRYGVDADLCGLDQGLYDALQHAGVVTDDWFFRTHDGTRIHPPGTYGGSPRVHLTITPLPHPPAVPAE